MGSPFTEMVTAIRLGSSVSIRGISPEWKGLQRSGESPGGSDRYLLENRLHGYPQKVEGLECVRRQDEKETVKPHRLLNIKRQRVLSRKKRRERVTLSGSGNARGQRPQGSMKQRPKKFSHPSEKSDMMGLCRSPFWPRPIDEEGR